MKPVRIDDHLGGLHGSGSALSLIDTLPKAQALLADRGYDASWLRQALKAKGIEPCIPPKKNRKKPISYDKTLYKQRHKVENMFAKFKDWRRIATRYDRRADIFKAAITIACIVIWWI
ncbi:MAG: IS5 family transposase [Alphaproteobacteria bacterium]|nr:MAG: IS5 family transposase [Alphaproteobacteria bacterium]